MAISRPLLVVLVGVLVLLAATTAVRALGSDGGEVPPATQTTRSPSAGASASTKAASEPKARPPARQTAAKDARKAKADDPQARVLRALAARQVVVLFFGQSRGADDQATRRAISALERRRDNIAVFTASIRDVSDYARVVGTLGIQQSPSTIVIDRGGRARLVQGFLDAGSLRQLVADARS